MNATCEHGPWPVRECTRGHGPAPILVRHPSGLVLIKPPRTTIPERLLLLAGALLTVGMVGAIGYGLYRAVRALAGW